jgi:hypothetical protein
MMELAQKEVSSGKMLTRDEIFQNLANNVLSHRAPVFGNVVVHDHPIAA